MDAPGERETIAAIATPLGRGAIGIVRISGSNAFSLAEQLTGRELPENRLASIRYCLDGNGEILDQGLLICFKKPNSFTGEDVVEFQGHGGPVLLKLIWQRLLALGARPARPGEFSERAFLNGRLDLAQAEAIADLIDAGSRQAAAGAMRSLRGEFSSRIEYLRQQLLALRASLEAMIDFSDEDDVSDLLDTQIGDTLRVLSFELNELLLQAEQGRKLSQGAVVVISGAPNVGKSTLLNRLAQEDVAIVTPVAGTTRDVLHTDLELNGIPLRIVDTAGLRETIDPIEKEGVARARKTMQTADLIVVMDTAKEQADVGVLKQLPAHIPVMRLRNKIDLSGDKAGYQQANDIIGISALTRAGIDDFIEVLVRKLGGAQPMETAFTARARHIHALKQTNEILEGARQVLNNQAGVELLAEELRRAHDCLGEITGHVTADQLLGEIFSSFCIGK